MNTNIINNYSKLKLSLFILPVFLLVSIALFLYGNNSLSVDKYIQIQQNIFFFINHNLGQYPSFQHNLTQLGDALIFLSLLSIFVVYAPKLWEALLSGALVSIPFSVVLKKVFAVPRPAAMFDDSSLVIIGEALYGHNSLPSGHSITVFTILAVLMFSFMPKELKYKILSVLLVVALGIIIVSSRIGVGAHYPLDVAIGSIIGYISGLAGIFICRKYRIWAWISNKKYYPIFILLFAVGCVLLINMIAHENLIIFYLSFISLLISICKIIAIYVKK